MKPKEVGEIMAVVGLKGFFRLAKETKDIRRGVVEEIKRRNKSLKKSKEK